MVDVLHPPRRGNPSTSSLARQVPGPGSRLGAELRELAQDLVGRPDRDELTLEEERLLADALDEAVAAILPGIPDALDAQLAPLVESLPLHARVALAATRRRLMFGLD